MTEEESIAATLQQILSDPPSRLEKTQAHLIIRRIISIPNSALTRHLPMAEIPYP